MSDRYFKSDDFTVSRTQGSHIVLTYKNTIDSKFPYMNTHKIFTIDYANLIIIITSERTGVRKNFTYANRIAHPSNYDDNHCNYEYWFVNTEKDIIAVFYVDMEI